MEIDRYIVTVRESICIGSSRQAWLEKDQNISIKRSANETCSDGSIVRQMIECIEVHSDGKLIIGLDGRVRDRGKTLSNAILMHVL